ncbi:ABC transporter ATP-binding protein [Tepidimicrobium xylanilyticum]|uniref:ABC-2 type transport system ATP-binding protein n=1 Tax=Tepidimicrobium xylanilyticum TaxID=1123352 RepID=A0A1H2ZB47_9FIRM|nr:ATP-binding cassette domain-containing protein [Tepidimicrobium xylanilyticum]GMG96436.1 daunorubicin resistance protein DrrA family ABC transporter ATP-binding protein [Tepidimicrobium xylanilyticum]SDX14610.1 ABC-2 type transport system ATP-binding protein [Tepidimicrobium xylanilyticum]
MISYAIEVNNLKKEFVVKKKNSFLKRNSKKEIFVAVDNISFQVRKGEIFGFLGPNGAGKTTTIKMISTLLRPTSGTAIINGIDCVEKPMEVLKNLGTVLTGERSIYWKLTGRENLEYFAAMNGITGKNAQKKIDYLLKRFNLDKRADETVEKYSTGMKQRVALAKALIADPEILILDEPTSGLDPQSARNLRELILEIKEEGRTILLTTHYMEEADQLSDRIAIIDHGQIIAMDTPYNLKNALNKTNVIVLELKDWNSNTEERIKGIPTVENITSRFDDITQRWEVKIHIANGTNSINDLITNIISSDNKIINFRVEEPTLEDVFINLTGKSLRE